MPYTVKLSNDAIRCLEKLDLHSRRLIRTIIDGLAMNPRQHGVIQLKDCHGLYRARAGDYRIIYDIDDTVSFIYVMRIGHRKELYRNLP